MARTPEAEIELWDGRRFRARVASRDPRRDLATLRIVVGDGALEPATPGDSTALRPGELVIAVGNPLGFAGALSTGVGALHRTAAGMGGQSWIRADVRLAPGNSGGPLANAEGRVIGINTAIVNGLGVAVPAHTALDFLRRGAAPSLGVVLRPVDLGLLLLEVDREGAAAHASLLPGDILLTRYDALTAALDSGRPTFRLHFLRGDRTRVREAVVRLDRCRGGRRVIRVQIAATSAVVRAGLESLIASSPDLTITDSYSDVVLAAVPLDELTPAPAIVLLGEATWTIEALRLGVRAVLPPDAGAAEILAAIQAAAAGMAAIDPGELESLVAAGVPQPAAEAAHPATAREREVLRMLADGAANKTIAWKLGISEHTVKFHVAQILAKLNAGTRTEAVTLGIRQGLILL